MIYFQPANFMAEEFHNFFLRNLAVIHVSKKE